MELTKNRMLHSLAVAKTMKEITEKRYPEDQELAQEMFILGLLHDIGYEFCEDEGEDHAKIGGDILRHQGYPYWKAVYFHGIPEKVYDTESLAKCAYSILYKAVKFAKENNVPIVWDI